MNEKLKNDIIFSIKDHVQILSDQLILADYNDDNDETKNTIKEHLKLDKSILNRLGCTDLDKEFDDLINDKVNSYINILN